jgi:hypothetical protein
VPIFFFLFFLPPPIYSHFSHLHSRETQGKNPNSTVDIQEALVSDLSSEREKRCVREIRGEGESIAKRSCGSTPWPAVANILMILPLHAKVPLFPLLLRWGQGAWR